MGVDGDPSSVWAAFEAVTEDPAQAHDYLRRPFPNTMDHAIRALLDAFRRVSPKDRAIWARSLPVDVRKSQILLTYAARMATQAIRHGSRRSIEDGLLAVLLEAERDDWRENVIVLTPLYDAAKRLGEDPRPLFSSVAWVAPELPSSQTIEAFPRRNPADLAIEAMGYRTAMSPQGVVYEPKPDSSS